MTEPYNAASAVTHVFMLTNVAIQIPGITPSGTAPVTVALAGVRPGDIFAITLAAGSTMPPTGVGPLGSGYCTTAGQLTIMFANNNGGLTTANSAVTNVTINVLVTSTLP